MRGTVMRTVEVWHDSCSLNYHRLFSSTFLIDNRINITIELFFFHKEDNMALLFNRTTRAVEEILKSRYHQYLHVSIDNSTSPFTLRLVGIKREIYPIVLVFLEDDMGLDDYNITPIFRESKTYIGSKGKRKKQNSARVGLMKVVEKRSTQKEKTTWIPNRIIYEFQTRLGYKNRFYNAWQKGY
jgi:hypothetical protein